MRYALMNKDIPLITFEFAPASLPGRIVRSVRIVPGISTAILPAEFLDVSDLMNFHDECEPIRFSEDFLKDPDGVFSEWLKDRRIPIGRKHARELGLSLGTTLNRYEDIAKTTAFLSLTDCRWIVPEIESSVKQWDEVSLYRKKNKKNEFDTTLSTVALTGSRSYEERPDQAISPMGLVKKFRRTPEFSTGGVLAKTWRFDVSDARPVLLKSGSVPSPVSFVPLSPMFHDTDDWSRIFGLEPYSEVLSGYLASRLGIDAVSYRLEYVAGMTVCACDAFTDEGTEFVPMLALVRDQDRMQGAFDLGWLYEKIEGSRHKLLDMLLFDALILNSDRHFGNFGFLRNPDTGQIVGVAPLFDHGSSLCHSISTERLSEPDGIKKAVASHFPVFGTSFESHLNNYIANRSDAEHVLKRLSRLSSEKSRTHEPFSFHSCNLSMENGKHEPQEIQKRLNVLDALLDDRKTCLKQLAQQALEKLTSDETTDSDKKRKSSSPIIEAMGPER